VVKELSLRIILMPNQKGIY